MQIELVMFYDVNDRDAGQVAVSTLRKYPEGRLSARPGSHAQDAQPVSQSCGHILLDSQIAPTTAFLTTEGGFSVVVFGILLKHIEELFNISYPASPRWKPWVDIVTMRFIEVAQFVHSSKPFELAVIGVEPAPMTVSVQDIKHKGVPPSRGVTILVPQAIGKLTAFRQNRW